MHDIHHQNSNVTERGATRTKVRKTLVTRGIDDQQPRNLNLERCHLRDIGGLVTQHGCREESGTNLLRDTTSLTCTPTEKRRGKQVSERCEFSFRQMNR